MDDGMNWNEKLGHVCPFCGQAVMEDGDPREHCDCGDAGQWRDAKAVLDKMHLLIAKYFGGDCRDVEPSWNPVNAAMYDWLKECARTVVFMDSCEKITVKIDDTSTAEISYGKVARKMNLKREEKV